MPAYQHVALALLSADEEYKHVKEPELFWVHGLQAATQQDSLEFSTAAAGLAPQKQLLEQATTTTAAAQQGLRSNQLQPHGVLTPPGNQLHSHAIRSVA